MDANSGDESAYPRPRTAWFGFGPTLVVLVTNEVFHDFRVVGLALSCITAPSVLIAMVRHVVAMLRASQVRGPSRSFP